MLTNLRRVVEYQFVDDSGAPQTASLAALVLQFAEADLVVEATADDEVVLRVEEQGSLQHWSSDDAAPHDASAKPHWSVLIGTDCPWRWQLTNQQGYSDGAQVEFTRGAETTTRQWIGAGSKLHEATVAGLF